MRLRIDKSDGTSIVVRQEDQVTVKKTLNSEDYITVNTISSTVLDVPVGSYLSCETSSDGSQTKYTLNKEPDLVKLSSTQFQYSFVFESPMYDLKKSVFRVLDDTDSFYIGDASDWIDRIVESLAADGYTFARGDVDSTIDMNLSFVGDTCWSMLNRVCEEFDLEFSIISNVISLTYKIYNDRGLSFSHTQGGGIETLTQEKSDAIDLVTRLYYAGGEKNLGSTYGYSRLQGSTKYISQNEDMYGVHADVEYFDDVYPTYTGTVGAVSYDDNGIPSFIDAATPFDINDYLISNVTASITMTSGDCAGYAFEIEKYDDDDKEFTIIQYESQNGLKIPMESGSLNIANGDTFKITEISLPTEYLTAATTELDAAAVDWLDDLSTQPLSYNVGFESDVLESVYLTENILDVGDGVGITDTYLNPPTALRIISIEYDLFYKANCKATLSETRFALAGRTEQIAASVTQKATYKNKSFEVVHIQKSAKTTAEVYNKTYDSYDGKLKSTNIRTENIDPYHVALDSGEVQFVIDSELSATDTAITCKAGTFKVRNYNALNRAEIAKLQEDGTDYVPVQTWTIAAGSTLKSASIDQYIYAKVDNTKDIEGVLTGTTATIYVDTELLNNKYTEDNYLFYLIGKVKADNSLSLLWSNSDTRTTQAGHETLTRGQHTITLPITWTDGGYFPKAEGKIDGQISTISVPTITPYLAESFDIYVPKTCVVYWTATKEN